MHTNTFTTARIAEIIGASLIGKADKKLSYLRSIELADDNSLTFAGEDKYISKLNGCKAGAVIVPREIEGLDIAQLVVSNVDEALISALEAFTPKIEFEEGVHKSAFVSDKAKVGKGTYIGAFCFIDDDVVIGDNTYIDSGVIIKAGSSIGSFCRIDANVVVYHGCKIGNNCVIQASTVIGSIGFGYRPVNNMPKLIPHNGGVVIEDFVEIGANCCIDRAKFGNTVIGMASKIDNLVQIAHNCKIGKCCLLAAQTGIAGSTTLGNGVIMGGQAGAVDHINISDGVTVAARCVISGKTEPGSVMFGFPSREYHKSMRVAAQVNKLPETIKRFKELEKRVANLEKTDDNSK